MNGAMVQHLRRSTVHTGEVMAIPVHGGIQRFARGQMATAAIWNRCVGLDENGERCKYQEHSSRDYRGHCCVSVDGN